MESAALAECLPLGLPFVRPSACEANTDDCGPRSARGRSTRAAQGAVGGPLVRLAGLVGRSILQIDTACARCMHARPGRGCRVGRCSTAGWSPGQPLDPPVGRAPVGRSQHRCSGELQRGGGGRQGAAARRGGSIHGREHDGQGTREERVVSWCVRFSVICLSRESFTFLLVCFIVF